MLTIVALLLLGHSAQAEKPTSFCYGAIGPGIQSRLHLHNSDSSRTVHVVWRIQTIAGAPVGEIAAADLKAGEDYETEIPPSETLQQIWALLTVTGPARKGAISMHSDGVLEGALITAKTEASGIKTRTNTLTPILVRDPNERPRGEEPNKSVLRLGAFFTGEFIFVGNPRERPLDIGFCSPRTGQCWRWRLAPRAAISVSLAEFQAALGIAGLDDYVSCDFRGATAFCNMRNTGADSAISFGEVR